MRAGCASLLFLLVTGCAENKPAAPAPAVSSAPVPAVPAKATWSPAVQGLRGRLVVTKVAGAPQPQAQIDLEIENVTDSAAPIELWWADPATILDLTLEDAQGTAIPKMAMPGSYATMSPAWLPVPVNSATRFTISKAIYERTAEGRGWVRPTTFQGWALTPDHPRWFLRGKLTTPKPSAQDAAGHKPWSGTLDLPPVELP